MLLLVLPVVLLFAAALWLELNDEFVGPAILAEAGQSYVTQSFLWRSIRGLAEANRVL